MLAQLRYSADHPCRPPHWRWERARLLRENSRSAPKQRDDKWVLMAVRLQSRINRAKDDRQRCKAYSNAGALGMALDIWDDQDRPSSFREELEARLLTSEPITRIAAQVGLSPEVVHAYEKTFFNVKDRLKCGSYIRHQILGDALHKGMSDKQIWPVVKSFAYFSGSADLVTALINTFPDMQGAKVTDIPAYLANDARWSLARKVALAARMIPLNSFTQGVLLEIGTKLAIAAQETGAVSSDDHFKSSVRSLLLGIPWTVRKSLGDTVGSLATVEPRAKELIEMAAGEVVEADAYESFTYPEPEVEGERAAD